MKTSGVSLVEILVALAILLVAVLPMFTLYSTTARQARQTGDYTLAVMLEERVAEDMRIASWENPHAVEDPRLNGDGTLAPVVDGKSIYFRGLEDTAAPFGQIDDRDRSIDASFPDLYAQLRTYAFGVKSARRALETQGEVLDLDLDMEWKDAGDHTRAMPLRTILPIIQPRITTPVPVQDRTAADAYIHQLLFSQRPQSETLTQAAAATQANLDALRALGDIMLVMGSFAVTRAEFDATRKSLTDAVTRASDPIERFRAEVGLGRYLEARTAVYVQAVVYLGDKVTLLSSGPANRLGTPPPDPLIYRDELAMTAWLPGRLAEAVSDSATSYTAAYNDPGALDLPRVRARVFMKLVELCKIQTLTAGPADPGHLQQILASYNVDAAGRNENFAAYGQAESQLCDSLDTLRAAFRTPALLDSYGVINASAGAVYQTLVPPPADNGKGGLTPPTAAPASSTTTGGADVPTTF